MNNPFTCPACNAHTMVIDGTIKYHLRPDNLAACERSTSRAEQDEPKPPAKKATRKATPKKK